MAEQPGKATGHASAAAEQSTASTQEVAASSRALARSAEELVWLLARFVI